METVVEMVVAMATAKAVEMVVAMAAAKAVEVVVEMVVEMEVEMVVAEVEVQVGGEGAGYQRVLSSAEARQCLALGAVQAKYLFNLFLFLVLFVFLNGFVFA